MVIAVGHPCAAITIRPCSTSSPVAASMPQQSVMGEPFPSPIQYATTSPPIAWSSPDSPILLIRCLHLSVCSCWGGAFLQVFPQLFCFFPIFFVLLQNNSPVCVSRSLDFIRHTAVLERSAEAKVKAYFADSKIHILLTKVHKFYLIVIICQPIIANCELRIIWIKQ